MWLHPLNIQATSYNSNYFTYNILICYTNPSNGTCWKSIKYIQEWAGLESFMIQIQQFVICIQDLNHFSSKSFGFVMRIIFFPEYSNLWFGPFWKICAYYWLFEFGHGFCNFGAVFEIRIIFSVRRLRICDSNPFFLKVGRVLFD